MNKTMDVVLIGFGIFIVLAVTVFAVLGHASGMLQSERIIDVPPSTKCIVITSGTNVAVDCWVEK